MQLNLHVKLTILFFLITSSQLHSDTAACARLLSLWGRRAMVERAAMNEPVPALLALDQTTTVDDKQCHTGVKHQEWVLLAQP